MVKKHSLYEVCICNHEFLQHNTKCSAIVPVGHDGYRGYVEATIMTTNCYCTKFEFSQKNTANPKPSGDN